jgi:gliding motility-associated-like protein
MPNAFTPNGDNLNDIYRIPPGVSITLNEFSIFDRWGNRVFTTIDITLGWNGTLKGSKSPNGVYTYFIRGADDKGSIVEKGSFTLIR